MGLNIKGKRVAVDCETTGLNPWRPKERWGIEPDRPFAVAFWDEEGNSDYVRWEVDPKTRKVLYDTKNLQAVREVMADPTIEKIFHNISFDHRMLEKAGIESRGKLHDTIFLTHVVTGGSERSYALKELADKYLNIGKEDQKALALSVHRARRIGKKKGWALATPVTHGKKEAWRSDYWMGDAGLCKTYALGDVKRTMLLFLSAYDDVMVDDGMRKTYQRELNLFWVMKRMEDRGCRVFPQDVERLNRYYKRYMAEQMRLVEKLGGKGLNFNSPKQMQKKFYKELKFKPKINDDGGMCLDSKQLARIAKESPLAKAILEWKAGDHMLSSFLEPYRRFMVQEGADEWILHPRYRQSGPTTGRMSCSDPNLMNVASDERERLTSIVLKPRECLGPRKGHIWLMPDWSQIEVWIFAFQGQIKAMMDALLSGKDFHGTISKNTWGKKPDFSERPKAYRKRAKAILFQRMYGGGKRATAGKLECSMNEAQEFISEFEEGLPGFSDYMERVSDEIREKGEIRSVFGRRYCIPEDYAYKGVNYNTQGPAADLAKRAMIRMNEFFESEWPNVHLILMLHDEFAIEVPKKEDCLGLRKDIIKIMQRDSKVIGVPVPLPVEMDIVHEGKRWAETKPLCKKHLIESCYETCKRKD